MEYYSDTKRSAFESVLMRWMNLEPIIQSEVIKRKTNIMCSVQFSHSVMSDSLQPHELQGSLSIINSWSSFKLTSIESEMPSSHLIL